MQKPDTRSVKPSERSRCCAFTATRLPSDKASTGGALMERPGNTKVRSATTLWVGGGPGGQSVVIERCIGCRLPPYRRLRVANLKLGARHKPRGRNLALEVLRRKIRSCRRGARIERHVRGFHAIIRSAPTATRRLPAPPGIRHPPDDPTSPPASRHKCRSAARPW